MKIRPLALLAGGAAAYYFLKTPKGRARLQQLKERGRGVLQRSDVQENISRFAEEAKKQTAGKGGIAEHGTKFVADGVQDKIRKAPTEDQS